jgi:hypothetical protein
MQLTLEPILYPRALEPCEGGACCGGDVFDAVPAEAKALTFWCPPEPPIGSVEIAYTAHGGELF